MNIVVSGDSEQMIEPIEEFPQQSSARETGSQQKARHKAGLSVSALNAEIKNPRQR